MKTDATVRKVEVPQEANGKLTAVVKTSITRDARGKLKELAKNRGLKESQIVRAALARLPAVDATKEEWCGWSRIVRPEVGVFPTLWLAPDGECALERARNVFPISLKESVLYVRWLCGAGGGYATEHWGPWLKALEDDLGGQCRSLGEILDEALESSMQEERP